MLFRHVFNTLLFVLPVLGSAEIRFLTFFATGTALKIPSVLQLRTFSLTVIVDYFHCLAFVGLSVSVGTRYVDIVITPPECVSLHVFDERMCVHSVDSSGVGFLR